MARLVSGSMYTDNGMIRWIQDQRVVRADTFYNDKDFIKEIQDARNEKKRYS